MSDTDKSELEQKLCVALYGKTTQELDLNQVEPFLDLRDKVLPLITQQCNQTRDNELKFLERLKIEFDANISMDVGEKWSESDAAKMVNNRLATLQAQAKETEGE